MATRTTSLKNMKVYNILPTYETCNTKQSFTVVCFSLSKLNTEHHIKAMFNISSEHIIII